MVMTRSLKRKEREKEESITHMGDEVDLSKLLFTETRDYLIRYNTNQQVKHNQLAGKVIVLYFVSLANGQNNRWESSSSNLVDIYNNLEPKGCFEVVYVAVRDGMPCRYPREPTLTCSTPCERYEENFSAMPWTAIPFSDLKSRKRLERMFGIFSNTNVDQVPIAFVINPRGVVVQTRAMHLFSRYGAVGYPYTNERLKCLDSEDYVAGKQLSVTTLLASPERDYVITNKGDQVPVHKLEDKVIALFFLTHISDNIITWKLKMAYEELSKNKEDFEVVLIYLVPTPFVTYEDKFWKTFEEMPWLAIPFKDRDCTKKLLRIFEYPVCEPGPGAVSRLVIIGPHGKFIEPFGANILMCYGIPAYPFTRVSAVKLKLENAKDVRPEMFWDIDSVFRQQNGSQVRFSQIVGKRIIVIFHTCYDLSKLKALYIQMKGTNDEFEVIYICEGGECKHTAMPWLTYPPFDEASDAYQLMCRVFDGGYYGIIAFDCDGRVVRMTSIPRVGKTCFPFYSGDDMEAEILVGVKDCFDEPLGALLHCW